MLRRAVEVVAITGAIALFAGIFALLELGATRAIPAIAGAALTAALIFVRRSRSYATAGLAALLSAAAAFVIDWFVLFVLAAGYPELRDFRRGPYYQALLVAIFGAIAALDAKPVSDESGARS